MDWKSRIRERCRVECQTLDDDVLEELGQHAAAAYETARAEGRSHDEAVDGVDALVAEWRRTAPALRRRPRRPTVVETGGERPRSEERRVGKEGRARGRREG